MKKEITIVGLGKMGGAMARRMMEKGWKVAGMDAFPETLKTLASEGVIPVSSYADIPKTFEGPRIVWLFLPPKKIVDEALFGANGIADSLSPGDIVIDGGNSFFKEAEARARKLKEKDIHFIDVGTSGGPGGARNGACLMIGGDREAFSNIEPLFQDFAREGAYQFFEGAGAGHFVKMVHNGIEYGMMQAIAEGFELLEKSDYQIDLARATNIYNTGSVIESRLVGWLEKAFKERGPTLEGVSTTVAHTGEGEWTVNVAKEMGIEVQVIKDSFQFRVDSEKSPRFAGKVVSALREQFGGHSVK